MRRPRRELGRRKTFLAAGNAKYSLTGIVKFTKGPKPDVRNAYDALALKRKLQASVQPPGG